ncbi:MAG: carboxylating nicotinate-nucleotide diphosphorylase, partial [Ferruginibacter sp.]
TFDEKLDQALLAALAEDIGDGDHSTQSSIDPHARGEAQLLVKQTTVFAGLNIIQRLFSLTDQEVRFKPFIQDGDFVEKGTVAFSVDASVHAILKTERLALNILQRMSGIATQTRRYTEQLIGTKARLLDTRKTTPNFRLFEKEAVRIGGGHNHRFGLFDMIMLKDNHIDFCGSLENALTRAKHYVQNVKPDLRIEIETRSLNDVSRVLHVGGAHRIMLDNFSPEDVQQAVELIGDAAETEASGGIDYDNIRQYAVTGVDYISCGAIIHQATAVDMSLKARIKR